jgi:hypothetical protein
LNKLSPASIAGISQGKTKRAKRARLSTLNVLVTPKQLFRMVKSWELLPQN